MKKFNYVRQAVIVGMLAIFPIHSLWAESNTATVNHNSTTTVNTQGTTPPPEGPLQRLVRARQNAQANAQAGTGTTTTDVQSGGTTTVNTTTGTTTVDFWGNSSWDTNWGKMNLRSSNGVISGQYVYNNGRLNNCTVSNRGRTLSCTWIEGPKTGKAVFTLGPDNNSFKGTYTYAGEGLSKGQEWNGVRLR